MCTGPYIMQVMKRTSLDRMDENMVSLLFQVCVHWVFELQATIVTYLYSLTGHTRRRGPPLDFDLAGTTELDEAAPSPARCKGSIKICSCLPRLNVLHSASMHHEVSIVPLHMCVVHFPLHISSGDRMPQDPFESSPTLNCPGQHEAHVTIFTAG